MRALLALLVVLGSCSDPDPPAEVTPVDEPTDEPDPDDPPTDEGDVEDEAPTALELPAEIPVPESLPMRAEVFEGEHGTDARWPVIAHPVPEVRETLNRAIAGLANELIRFAPYGLRCAAPLAHEALVSVVCSGTYDVRGGVGVTHAEMLFGIHEGDVIPLSPRDAFLPDTDLSELATERCARDSAARISQLDDEDDEGWIIDTQCDEVFWTLGANGLAVRGASTTNGTVRRLSVPYEALRDRIRADGPLAPVLSDGEWSPRTVSEDDADGWAVTGFGPEPTLVRRWMELDPAAAADLVVDEFGGGLSRLVRPGADSGPARRIASSLGAEATPIRLGDARGRLARIEWDDWYTRPAAREAMTLRWVRTREDLNLRRRSYSAQRSETVIGVLPAGSLVAAVGGELGQRGQYVQVVTARGPGELASRYLVAHEDCVVAPGAEDRQVARVQVRRAGASRDAWLVVARRGPGSRVSLHERGDDCAPGAEILAVDVERPAFDVRLTGTTRGGGHTLLVVGHGASRTDPDRVRYRVFRAGARQALIDETFDLEGVGGDIAVRLGEEVGEAYYPVTIDAGEVERFVWSDDALRAAPAPE